jgi:hypothetical protein
MSLAPASRRTRKFAKARSRPGRQAANQRQGQQERFAFVYSLSIAVHFLCGHAPVLASFDLE